jgi:hypothetical protein
MKLKLFQKQDLARAALHDGLILSWDTGLGKTWALYLWPLLKVGYLQAPADPSTETIPRIRPRQPVLIIAPGDLHQQIAEEGWTRFRIRVVPLDSQETFGRLVCNPGSVMPNLSADGRPVLAPEFYITSYTQLTTNGVHPMPDAFEWEDAFSLQRWLCLPTGNHVEPPTGDVTWDKRPDFESACHFFAWRGLLWKDEFFRLHLHPDDSAAELEAAHERELEAAEAIGSPQLRGKAIAGIEAAYAILRHLFTAKPCPRFVQLATEQQAFVLRHFCAERIERYNVNNGFVKEYPIGPLPEGYVVDKPETDTRPKWRVKCLYQPSLADLSYNAFEAVAIDEGVKMKGEDTHVGRGVRSMQPKHRLVLTATPVKNRVPDIFRLAWWATGGKAEAHARFPYRDDSEERAKFASTFMVTERNMTRIAKAREANGGRSSGSEGSGRFTKLTAEVCNVHRLWKLLGPIVLRRRKDDCHEDIVPKIRRVVRCEMGTHQQRVYQYHLQADYLDTNGLPATGAKLQALRMAAADSSSEHLKDLGPAFGECSCCFSVPECVHGKNDQGEFVEFRHPKITYLAQQTTENWNVFSVNGKVDLLETVPDKDTAVKRANTLSDRHRQPPEKNCRHCRGSGKVQLPARSGQAYIPKFASTLSLIHEILERKEQCVVFSAFTDPLDRLSGWLSEANVRHVKLDGRTSQKKRGRMAATFKRGREASDPSDAAVPVMLAGVECMAEGHSFHRANNVILIAYSWAYDKFIQAINRVHRMNSAKPVNIYVVLCIGTIDRKLESLIGDKGDAAELVLDGRLIGERTEEVNLSELLQIAHREFDGRSQTIDEALLHAQWPELRDKLSAAMRAWEPERPALATARADSDSPLTNHNPNSTMRRTNPVNVPKPTAPSHNPPCRAEALAKPDAQTSAPSPDWRARLAARAARLNQTQPPDAWAAL